MKITFILPVAGENGGTRVVGIYAEKLLAMGHDVTVVSRVPRRRSRIEKIDNFLRGRRLRISPSRTRFLDGLGARHIQIDRNGPLLPGDVPDADVIIATWWRTAFEVAILPPEKGEKVYFVQHHEVHEHLPYDLSAGSYHLPLHKITIAQWLVDTMAELYGDEGVPMVVNSVDTEQFFAPPREKNTPPTVGLLYSPVAFKGLDVSLKAIQIARETIPDLRVLAFGLQDPAPSLPLPEGAAFFKSPDQNKIRDIYAQCDVWLCGSRAEGFHLPPLEAMACRVPVVSTRIGGAVETIEDGVNGFLVDIDDSAALGRRLTDVASLSSGDWLQMSQAAHARAHAYSWDDAARKFETALHFAIRQN